MRAGDRTDHVVSVVDGAHPVAERLVECILQSARTRRHGDDCRPEQAHACDVECLPLRVDLAHVDDALEAEQRSGRCRRDPVLTGARFGNDPGLAHSAREQHLPEHIVDLVRAGVVEVFALEQHPRTDLRGQPLRVVQQRRPSRVVGQQSLELGLEAFVGLGLVIRSSQLVERGDECFRDVTSAVRPEPAWIRWAWVCRAHVQEWRVAGWVPAATRSATACRGLFCLTSPSPTSTASAPAAAYASRSCGPRTPLSATFTEWSGSSGAIRANVSRSTSSVRRLRAFTPMTRAPASAARRASSSSCTSTRAVMPRLSVRSSTDTSAFCSSAATMTRTMSAP